MQADHERIITLALEWQRAVEDYSCRQEGDNKDVLARWRRAQNAENALAWAVRRLPEFKERANVS